MRKKRLCISSLFYFWPRTAERKVGYGKKKSDCGRGGTSDLMIGY